MRSGSRDDGRRRRLPRAFALATALALLAGACGGGATGGDDQAAATPSPSPGTTATAGQTGTDGPLVLGYLLPETGPLASLGPGVIAGTRLAVTDITEAGGVLGEPLELLAADSAGDPTVAGQAVSRLLGDGAQGIVGAVSSAISLAVVDRIKSEQVAQCSGSNTSETFTNLDDDGYYVRTAPSNVLQAPVLANAILDDGSQTVSILVRGDDYGASIGGALEENLTDQGATVTSIEYDPEAASFDAELEQATAGDPDAVVVVAFDEGSRLLAGLIELGAGPGDKHVYGTDGMGYAALAEQVAPGQPELLEGLKGTQTSSAHDPGFDERLREENPSLEVTNFAPYFYDCVVVLALAAEAAGSSLAVDYTPEIVGVTRDGEKCTTFAECRDLLADGQDIDYDGVSGPLDFIDVGEPAVGIFDVIRFDAEGNPEIVDTVEMGSGA
jgi:ABC-type branched-subunit amino acid transport system substrate-binding protein